MVHSSLSTQRRIESCCLPNVLGRGSAIVGSLFTLPSNVSRGRGTQNVLKGSENMAPGISISSRMWSQKVAFQMSCEARLGPSVC